ncbi:kinase-like protein, partial [Thelephora ganbajun]
MTTEAEDSARHGQAQLKARVLKFLDTHESLPQIIQGSTPEDQDRFFDKMDQVFLTLDAQNAKFFVALGEVCSTTDRLPASAIILTGLKKHGTIAIASGGLTDVWTGEYDREQAAIKAFRTYPDASMEEAKKILWKRVPMWRRFNHPNVARFLGVNTELFNGKLALVYDWAANGNIVRYTKSHPGAPRPVLLLQVAKGLQYFHSLDVTHGNLKGANVLINGLGQAQLTDYGFAPINSSIRFTVTEFTAGNARWLAPEIIRPPPGASCTDIESKSADVFAFAMVAVEVFTGNLPFEEQGNPGAVNRIFRGDRPAFPQNAEDIGLTVQMWEFLRRCWHPDHTKRPTIDEVVRTWEGLLGDNDEPGPTPPPAETGGQPIPTSTRRTRNFWRKFLCM